MTEPSALELADRLATMPANEAVRGPQDWALIMRALRAPPAQGEPVAWHWLSSEGWVLIPDGKARADALRESGYEIRSFPASIPPAVVAEDCAKIAEGHVGAGGQSVVGSAKYDEACRDIAKAIRDTYGHE